MRVEIIDITDRSGSMGDIRDDVIGGFNAFIADQKTVPGECRFTQIQFDDKYELIHSAVDIQTVQPLTRLTYVPRGGTALHDAIGRTLNEHGQRIARQGWAEKVIVCIRTDGEENSSKEYKLPEIKRMIEHAQSHGWVFMFSGADIDAFAAGGTLGISAQYTTGYSKSMVGATMDSYCATGQAIRNLRTEPTV